MPIAKNFTRNSLAAGLSFSAGFIDVIGFIALAGLFTAHVTGNFIMIGVESASPQDGLLLKLLALPVFVLAVGGTRLAEDALMRRGRDPVVPLLGLESALLAIFAVAGTALQAAENTNGSQLAMLSGFAAVAAMAIQNALSRTSLAELGPTTIMTGNSTQIVIDLVDLLGTKEPEARAAIRQRLAKMGPSVLAFAAGAILGAMLFRHASYRAVALPIGVLLAACACRLRLSTQVPSQG